MEAETDSAFWNPGLPEEDSVHVFCSHTQGVQLLSESSTRTNAGHHVHELLNRRDVIVPILEIKPVQRAHLARRGFDRQTFDIPTSQSTWRPLCLS